MASLATSFPITDPTLIFFVVLLIILFAPIIMGKLRIPHLIGMVLAGVLVGKYGLNILSRDASFELFGRVGLYYIMFLASLEMDMEGLRRNKWRTLIFGLLTFAIPFLLTYVMGIGILGYTPIAALLLGCVMASNTLVSYPIVSRYGLQQKPSVVLSVGSTMISLFLALVILAALVAGNDGKSNVLFWLWFVVKLVLYVAVVLLIVPRLTRCFLRRYSDSVMQFIFVLSVLFLCAALAGFVGLEGVFGAFFAGLVLNRYIPPVSPQADAENPRMSMPRRDSRQFALHLHAQDTARIELEQLVGPLEQGGTQILQSYTEYPVCFVKRPAQSFLHPFILEYIGDGSFIQRCLRILKAAACRQNDDLHLGETGADVAHQRNTIFPGKTHVHHDDMRRQPPTELRHLFPALCDANALALVRQPGKVVHALQKGGIVIYKQYAQHNGFLLCSTSGTLFRSHLTE